MVRENTVPKDIMESLHRFFYKDYIHLYTQTAVHNEITKAVNVDLSSIYRFCVMHMYLVMSLDWLIIYWSLD